MFETLCNLLCANFTILEMRCAIYVKRQFRLLFLFLFHPPAGPTQHLPHNLQTMHSFIAVLALFLGLTVASYAVFQHDFSLGVLENPSYAELVSTLSLYQEQHSLEHMSTDEYDPSFCDRQFAIGIYACPQMIGNRMHEFLNAYVGAFVTNRTLVWQFCTRRPCQLDNEGDCSAVLERFPWMSSSWKFRELWKSNKCEGTGDAFEVIPQRFRYMADEVSMCCGFDEIKESVVQYGTHEGHEFYGLSTTNARLAPASKYRAKLLFEHGENFGYGVLFRTVFRFRDAVIKNNNRNLLAAGLHLRHTGSSLLNSSKTDSAQYFIPSTSPRPFVIGVHLRHAGGEENGVDPSGMKCVQHFLHDMNITGPCYVLLASDRNDSVQHWIHSKQQPCQVITSPHDQHHTAYNEHGPFTGLIAMQDIELVSRADVLIGSGYTHHHLQGRASTFSLLVAERLASNGGHYSASTQSRFLQACVPVHAARFRVLDMYAPDAVCPERPPKDMPDLCNTTSITL